MYNVGDYVRLRNGEVRQVLVICPVSYLMRLSHGTSDHYPSGRYTIQSESPLDIMEVTEAPIPLPEPVERFINFAPSGYNGQHHDAASGAVNCRDKGDKTYRCRIEFLEEIKS